MNNSLHSSWGRVLVSLVTGILALVVGLGTVIATESLSLGPRPTEDPFAQMPLVAPTLSSPTSTVADASIGLVIPTPTESLPTPIPQPTETQLPEILPSESTPILPEATDTPMLESTPLPVMPESPAAPTIEPTLAVTETVEILTPEVEQEAEIPTDTPPSSAAENAGAIPGRTINAAGSNLRQGPGLDQAVVVVLPADTRVLALTRTADGSWVRVLAPALVQSGWLRADQVELEGDVMALPEATSGE